MARTAAPAATSANTSKKRKTTADAEEAPAKRARTIKNTANGTTKKDATATEPKVKAKATSTKKAPAKKAAAAKPVAKPATKPVVKAAPKRKTLEPKSNTRDSKANVTVQKRKSAVKEDQEERAPAKAKSPAPNKAKIEKFVEPPKPKERKKGPVINTRPAELLNVFVFGENSSGELGLGEQGNVIDVKRPRLNPLLKDKKVVGIAAGGMHQAFLTDDGKILTCGVNDQGALGRDTAGAEKLRDVDASGSDDEDDNGLNPLESTPMEVDLKDVPEGTVFTSLAAGDSVTFAVTDEGLVYGCGTFRSNEGILGFTADIHVQKTLTLVPGVKHISKMVCGANHALALDKNGGVWAWGSGQQNQLGRRVVERTRMAGLTPREFGLPKKKVVHVASGAYHSFAIDKNDKVWTWGLNSYGECGIEESAGEDDAVVEKVTAVTQLSGRGITQIDGGAHHSMAVTDQGEALVWGRTDGYQLGLNISTLDDDDIVRDEHNKPRILKKATVVKEVPNAVFATCNSDQSFIINRDGRAFASGFSVNYQTGLGTTEDVEVFTLIDNTATREEKLVFAGAGGQYGVLASVQKS